MQITHIKSVAVFIGSSGLEPWQEPDINELLQEFVNRKRPVIPVLLPTASKMPQFPAFLRGQMWVDFRQPQPEPMKQLIWGITGKKPKSSTSTSSNKSTITFSFEAVTVNHYGAIIKRGTLSARYFTQDLSNNVTLDMVAIPGGSFIMGAPERVATEVKEIDILFIPKVLQNPKLAPLGLLGKFAEFPAIFEPFRNPALFGRHL